MYRAVDTLLFMGGNENLFYTRSVCLLGCVVIVGCCLGYQMIASSITFEFLQIFETIPAALQFEMEKKQNKLVGYGYST
jgi:hypothetical protein